MSPTACSPISPYPGSVPRGRGARLGQPFRGREAIAGCRGPRRSPTIASCRRRRLRAAVHRVEGQARADRSRGKGLEIPLALHRHAVAGDPWRGCVTPGQARFPVRARASITSHDPAARPRLPSSPRAHLSRSGSEGLARWPRATVGRWLAFPLFILLDLWLPPLALFGVIVVLLGIGSGRGGAPGRVWASPITAQ